MTKTKSVFATKEETDIVVSAIHQTWQSIGYDVEQACAEENERLTNEGALECCIDAERVEMYGGTKRKEAQAILRRIFDDKTIGYTKVMKELKKLIKLA